MSEEELTPEEGQYEEIDLSEEENEALDRAWERIASENSGNSKD